MGDMGDYWKGHRDYVRAKRDKYTSSNMQFICDWATHSNVFCEQLKGTQFRLDNLRVILDIWPTSLKWHNITTNERGQCRNQTELFKLLSSTMLGHRL